MDTERMDLKIHFMSSFQIQVCDVSYDKQKIWFKRKKIISALHCKARKIRAELIRDEEKK